MPSVYHLKSIEWFIDTVLLGDMKKMMYECKLHYLGIGNVAVGIEFLGACLDDFPFDEAGHSKPRFAKGISEFMHPIHEDYEIHNRSESKYYLYQFLRCGMAHVIRPGGKVMFTSREESQADSIRNLSITENHELVLVAEDFYDDFERACLDLKSRLPALRLKHPKLKRNYFSICDYSSA